MATFAGAMLLGAITVPQTAPTGDGERGHYIVRFVDSVDDPRVVAHRHVERHDAELRHVYVSAIKGYAATMSALAARRVADGAEVASVEADQSLEPMSAPASEPGNYEPLPTRRPQTIEPHIRRTNAADAVRIDCDPEDPETMLPDRGCFHGHYAVCKDAGEPISPSVNSNFHINCRDDYRVDADVAVFDDGVDALHPDLNVERSADCMSATQCIEGSADDWNPHNWTGHGTSIASGIGALDNHINETGIAPGARIWAIKIAESHDGNCHLVPADDDYETHYPGDENCPVKADDPDCNLPAGHPDYPGDAYCPVPEASFDVQADTTISRVIAGLDWLHANHADEVDVAAMALGCQAPWEGEFEADPVDRVGSCSEPTADALVAAVDAVIEAGIVIVAAAGNNNLSLDGEVGAAPLQTHPDVITASLVVDTDGKPGHEGPLSEAGGCAGAPDDVRARQSNYGSSVAIAVPLVCGGTSMATSIAAGAAAALASSERPSSYPTADYQTPKDYVVGVRQALIDSGNAGSIEQGGYADIAYDLPWDGVFAGKDDPHDGHKEPLLDVGDEQVFDPKMIRCGEARVDNDCRSDLVALDGSGGVRTHHGTPSGFDVADPAVSLEIDSALIDGSGRYLVDVADVDGDGRSDLVTLKGSGGVIVHRGQTDGTFGSGVPSLSGGGAVPIMNGNGSIEPIAVADVNGDGYGDAVAFNHFMGGMFVTALGQPDGTFDSDLTISLFGQVDSALMDGEGDYFLDVVDVDGDGRADVVASHVSGGAADLHVYRAQSDGSFAAATVAGSLDPIMDDGQGEEPIGLADMNGDGRADLLTLSDTDDKLKLRLGKADGTFEAPTTAYDVAIDSSLLDGTGQEFVGLLDYEGDGRADLVAIDDGDVLTYKSKADGTLAAPVVQQGSLATIRQSPLGHELVSQKPFIRRAGCNASGCPWPPSPDPEHELEVRDGATAELCDDVAIDGNVVTGGCLVEEMTGGFDVVSFFGIDGSCSTQFDIRVDRRGEFYGVNQTNECPWNPWGAACQDPSSGEVIPWEGQAEDGEGTMDMCWASSDQSQHHWKTLDLDVTLGLANGSLMSDPPGFYDSHHPFRLEKVEQTNNDAYGTQGFIAENDGVTDEEIHYFFFD